MPEDFQLLLVKPRGFDFVEGFRDVMEALQDGLRQLGYSAPISENRVLAGLTPIVFGAHHAQAAQLPPASIIYNLEQLVPGYPWYDDALQIMRHFRVWDFSHRNVRHLHETGVNRSARHVPLGYAPCQARVGTAPEEDVDVLFYGLQTDRRVRILKALGDAGLKTVALHNVWGTQRDAWIARAKVVLNLHQQERGFFEIVRVLPLLANRKAVVSECAELDEIDADLRAGICAVPYAALVDACVALVRDDERRGRLAAAGFEAVTSPDRQMASILARHLPARVAAGAAIHA